MNVFKRKYLSIVSNENNKLIFSNIVGSFLVKGCALFVSFFSMPAYINYFNDQSVLGLWFTMLSVLSWILTFDLGIGNGLRNHLVPVLIKKDNEEVKKYISSAYIVVGIIVLFITAIAISLFNFINWNKVFNISTNIIDKRTLLISVSIVFSGIMLYFLLKLINSILYAMQKSALNNFLGLLNSLIILAYLLFSSSSELSVSLIRLSVVHVLAMNIPLVIVTIYIFSKKLKYARPRISFYRKEYAKNILTLGGMFFWIQIIYMIITTTNDFLITWLAAPSYVVEYQVYYKLFTLIGTIFTLALTPIWSAVTKALTEKNINWIIKLYNLLKKLTLLAVVAEFFMMILLQLGIDIWLGSDAIEVNYSYAFIFAIYGSIHIWNGVLSSIANGLGELRIQAICYTIGVILKFPLAWVFVYYFNSWIGVVLANIIAMGLYSVIQPYWLNKILKEKNGGQQYV